MTLGDRIKATREAAGMTQEELGRICGTTKQTIYKYETGVITNIPIDRLKKIADHFGLPVGYLLGIATLKQSELPREIRRIIAIVGSKPLFEPGDADIVLAYYQELHVLKAAMREALAQVEELERTALDRVQKRREEEAHYDALSMEETKAMREENRRYFESEQYRRDLEAADPLNQRE